MEIKKIAKKFAIEAHKGQFRKADREKPMIIHPIEVANILESYGFDDNVVAAGFLHDVIEDTKYTNNDIEEKFGTDIESLVVGASEPDKSLSWEDRKKHTIEETRKLVMKREILNVK
jgi:(p)ppGpp synthase/HD superfamily hydrolase